MRKNNSMKKRVLQCAIGAAVTVFVAGCGQAPEDEAPAEATQAANPEPASSPAGGTVTAAGTPSLGSITTRVGGETTTWETYDGVPGDELRRASANFARQGPMLMLTLQALLPGSTSSQASLSANLMDQGDGYQPMNDMAELDMYPEGARGPALQALKLAVQWERIEIGEKDGHVQGTFTGFLCPLGSDSETAEGCAPLEGEFDSRVRHDEVVQDILN